MVADFSSSRIKGNVTPAERAKSAKVENLVKSIQDQDTHDQLLAAEREELIKKAKNKAVQDFIEKDNTIKEERQKDWLREKAQIGERDAQDYCEHLQRVGCSLEEKERKAQVLSGFWNEQVRECPAYTF